MLIIIPVKKEDFELPMDVFDGFGKFFLKWVCLSILCFGVSFYFTSCITVSIILGMLFGVPIAAAWDFLT